PRDPHSFPTRRSSDLLAALPEDYRVVCTLYFMDDLAYQDIADIVGIPVGTVRSRLHRGRKMLQKRLWQVAHDLGIVGAANEAGRSEEHTSELQSRSDL